MNKQQATIEALQRIAALARVNLMEGGDLMGDLEGEDFDKVAKAVEEVARGLSRRVFKLEWAERERRQKGKPRLKPGNWYEVEWRHDGTLREVKILEATWRGPEHGWWYGSQDDRGQRYGFHEGDVTVRED